MKHISTKLEDLQKAYPTMPTEICDMIQREVALRTKTVSSIADRTTGRKNTKFSWKKTAISVLAATMILGTTVLANEAIGRLRVQKEGKYALNIGVIPASDALSSDTLSSDALSTDNLSTDSLSVIPEQIPRLSLKAGYIPEGYCSGEALESWNVYPKETPYQNGLDTVISTLGEEITKDGFPLTIDYVLYSEEIPWQDRTALYVELRKPYWDAPMKRIYIPLPEYWQGLIVYARENTSKEEMIKYAENLEVIREEGTYASAGRLGWVEHPVKSEETLGYGTWKAPADRVLKNLHPVGETFPLLNTIRKVSTGAELSACVKKVEVFDDFSPLDSRYLDDVSQEFLDGNHKLKPNLIRYMSEGDGIASLSTEVTTQSVAQKLVYVTVEYTNISDRDLQNITDCASLCRMIEKDDNFVIYDRAREDGNPGTDYIMENEYFSCGRLIYCDACIADSIGERRVIPQIKAGESVTIHIAGVVNEDELDKLYLSFGGGKDTISEWTLAGGYVDLRQ